VLRNELLGGEYAAQMPKAWAGRTTAQEAARAPFLKGIRPETQAIANNSSERSPVTTLSRRHEPVGAAERWGMRLKRASFERAKRRIPVF
jgi:hypothetical protein